MCSVCCQTLPQRLLCLQKAMTGALCQTLDTTVSSSLGLHSSQHAASRASSVPYGFCWQVGWKPSLEKAYFCLASVMYVRKLFAQAVLARLLHSHSTQVDGATPWPSGWG